MLRTSNASTILCEEQSKFILDRISSVEKHFSDLCGAFAEFTRKVARLRDRSDDLAHVTSEYSEAEKYNKSLASGLSSLSKAITLIGDFQDLEVKRLENRIVSELSQYEIVCKHCKESVKETIMVRDKELAKRKQLDQSRVRNARGKKTAKDAELMKTNLEVAKSLKEMEEIVGRFEKRKLENLKGLLLDFVMIELKFHSNAVEVLSATYQDIADIDENRDYQQFKKYLQQDELSDRYFLQRIKSQSMGALSSMFAAGSASLGRKNKSFSSTSLNSSQEHTDEQPQSGSAVLADEHLKDPHQRSTAVAGIRRNSHNLQRSTESLDSVKRDLFEDSKTSSDEESDSDDESETESEEQRKDRAQPAVARTHHTGLVKQVMKNPRGNLTSTPSHSSPRTTYFVKSINGIFRNIKV
ncbi:CBY1-interacting BAR domain-containing protein 1-A isoform X2 [Uranotaenia lowii]|uniref:CBY1-interacting BAR domain-containing protein 1-A isoform X2 n=1 Tax=Uranotaenia lowii TaxID=190385 RepID=UPI002478F372|nr:CBY1-interacting BAR domain-containing protein 1-A isoform X2 [Uranotaenia lowii]